MRCDVTLNNYFIEIQGSFTINPRSPVDGSLQDPDDDISIQNWGESTDGHGGWFAMGTPNRIILPGNQYPENIY
eukprot:UN21012